MVHGGKWKAGQHFPSRSAQTEGKMLAQPPAQERRGHTGSSPQPEGPNRPRGDLLELARNPGIPGARSICKCLATKREEPCSARGALVLLRTGGLGQVNVGCRELGEHGIWGSAGRWVRRWNGRAEPWVGWGWGRDHREGAQVGCPRCTPRPFSQTLGPSSAHASPGTLRLSSVSFVSLAKTKRRGPWWDVEQVDEP